MTAQTYKVIVRRFFYDVLRDGKLEILDEIMALNCSYTDGGKLKHKTRHAFTNYVRESRAQFTRVNLTLHDIVAEGDRVTVRRTYHLKTEKSRYTLPVTGIFRFRENKIVEIRRNIAAREDTKTSS
jgi:predicted SnoaL-like aldol condensation-catalyzing enzyme